MRLAALGPFGLPGTVSELLVGDFLGCSDSRVPVEIVFDQNRHSVPPARDARLPARPCRSAGAGRQRGCRNRYRSSRPWAKSAGRRRQRGRCRSALCPLISAPRCKGQGLAVASSLAATARAPLPVRNSSRLASRCPVATVSSAARRAASCAMRPSGC